MKVILSIITSIFILGCTFKHNNNQEISEGYRLTKIAPLIGPMGIDFSTMDSTIVFLYYLKNGTKIYSYTTENLLQENGGPLKRLAKLHYTFVDNPEVVNGKLYKSGSDGIFQTLKSDSFISKQWFSNINLPDVFEKSDHRLVEQEGKKDGIDRYEKYTLKGFGKDSTRTGTFELFYKDSFTEKKFSLSNKIEKEAGLNLQSVILVTFPFTIDTFKFETFEMTYKLDKLMDFNHMKELKYLGK